MIQCPFMKEPFKLYRLGNHYDTPNVYHQAPDFKAYTGRAEPFENDKACYWYQYIQAFDDALNRKNNQKTSQKLP